MYSPEIFMKVSSDLSVESQLVFMKFYEDFLHDIENKKINRVEMVSN